MLEASIRELVTISGSPTVAEMNKEIDPTAKLPPKPILNAAMPNFVGHQVVDGPGDPGPANSRHAELRKQLETLEKTNENVVRLVTAFGPVEMPDVWPATHR